MALVFTDRRPDPAAWARDLGISREAIDLYASCDSIDLHIDSFIWTRMIGYDLSRRHGTGLLDARVYSQVDFPRVLEAGMTGGVWSIDTNPFRRRRKRPAVFLHNLQTLRAIIEAHPEHLVVASDYSGYVKARQEGKYACWLAIQGGNALDATPQDLDQIPGNCITRITVVHLRDSTLGSTSSPMSRLNGGLTDSGRDYVRSMNAKRILVDLAHINRRGFFDALEVHDRTQPAIVSHTGIQASCQSWRNIDDEQIKAIADLGGVIGIMFHNAFLGQPYFGGTARAIVDHMEQVIRVGGEDFVALGSDWDGLIFTPRDMKTVLELPRIVQFMLDRQWSAERVRKILGGNHLRVMKQIRG
jgi:membrane dipeptidase